MFLHVFYTAIHSGLEFLKMYIFCIVDFLDICRI